ncbi:MAG: methyltransferase domain-containing protein [Acidimicrobiia bacterium]
MTPNDPRLYEDLATEWWRPNGRFAPLHWLARERAYLVPEASRIGATLLDLGCGGGLLAPHIESKGYTHVGCDIGAAATVIAGEHGVVPVRADVRSLPFRDNWFDIVVAGELLEHVRPLETVIGEAARVLAPGGLLIIDTLAPTRRCRFLMVTVAERVGVIPRGIHDPELFVDPVALTAACSQTGVDLELRGLRPRLVDAPRWYSDRRDAMRMATTRSLAMVYQGIGRKRAA